MATITIIGAGYVGLTTAALLSECGHTVYTIDINPARLSVIQSGRSFFYEEGLDSLIKHNVNDGRLIATDSYDESIPKSAFVFSCVGTPDNPDGSSNLSYVHNAAVSAAKVMKNGTIYIQKSTVPVGTGARLETIFAKNKKAIKYVSNPEFLREGTAILDTLWFDRVVVGGQHKAASKKVLDLYSDIEKNRKAIARRAGLTHTLEHHGDYFMTNLNSAELIKVTANAFLALKISFANSIAKLADQTGADINEVMDAVGADKRIGRAFLEAGRGYGGGCFPKDVSGLISSANEYGIDLSIMTAAADLNASMPGYIANKLQGALGSLDKKPVAVLGLAFKAGTSDARRSPGVNLANILAHSGAKVTVYDPKANGEAKEDLRRDVTICDSLEAACEGVVAVCVATKWPEFIAMDLVALRTKMTNNIFVDGVNTYSIQKVKSADLQYIGVGR